MSRIGLRHLSTSARNSPFGVEKSFLTTQNNMKTHVEPLKKYQPITPSPLATSSPSFNVFKSRESVENKEKKTIQMNASSTQTNVSTTSMSFNLTPEDLISTEPTVNYLRAQAIHLQQNLKEEVKRNSRLVEDLCQLDEKIQKLENDTELLLEVLQDIDDEQKANEEGEAHL